MSSDLRSALGRAAAPDGDRPDLDGLWAEGRARRRRSRLLSSAAALVAVAVLAVGAVALIGGGDEDQGVVAGPDGVTLPVRPPPEPTGGFTATIESGPVVAAIPTVDPAAGLTVTYAGEFSMGLPTRGPGARWEEWDGQRWTHTFDLVADWGAGGGGVVPARITETRPDEFRSGAGPDRFAAPPDLRPGYYRVCRDMAGSGVQVMASPCAQVWVPGDGPVEEARPDDGEGGVGLELRPGEVPQAGGTVALRLTVDQGESTLDGRGTFEVQRSDGRWEATHALAVAVGDLGTPGALRIDAMTGSLPPLRDHSTDRSTIALFALVPGDADLALTSRICVAVTTVGGDRTPCVVVAGDESAAADGPAVDVVNGPIEVGGRARIEVVGGEGWFRSGVIAWQERRDGAWTSTHALREPASLEGDDLSAESAARPIDPDEELQPSNEYAADRPAVVRIPDSAEPGGAYRVCVALGRQPVPNEPLVDIRESCAEVAVVAPDEPIEPAPSQAGDPVTWTIDLGAPVTAGATRLRIFASRPGCPGTADLRPEDVRIAAYEDDGATTTLTLVLAEGATVACPPDDGSTYVVRLDLPTPLPALTLVDGACAEESDLTAEACASEVRWLP